MTSREVLEAAVGHLQWWRVITDVNLSSENSYRVTDIDGGEHVLCVTDVPLEKEASPRRPKEGLEESKSDS
jgi:hypothetical protein